MAWATEDDLIVGDLNLRAIDTGAYLDDAENQMLMYLGRIYELPFPTGLIEDDEALSRTFKFIQARLASGTLLMAQAAAAENRDVHQYGLQLTQVALQELCRIGSEYELVSGDLRAVRKGQQGRDMVPRALVVDEASPVDLYADFVHKQGSSWLTWGT